jgi:hypothetical protein
VDLTTDAVKDIAAECLTTCGYWRWGQARLGPPDPNRLELPGTPQCEHGEIYDELAKKPDRSLAKLYISYYLDGTKILKREMAGFRAFN